MDRVSAVLPLVLGGFGVLLLYRVLLRLRSGSSLKDRVVVITGASSGLGKECVRVFFAAGAKLIICGRDESKLLEVVMEITHTHTQTPPPPPPCIVVFDLADSSSIGGAAEEILRCYGRVDVLVNNAGVSYRGNVLETSVAVHRKVMETNYFGPVALTQALLPSMLRHGGGGGHVVVISSVQGRISIPYRSAYSASKHATQAYFDCLRAELQRFGVHVSVISPGYIRTDLSINAVTGDGSKYGVLDQTTAGGRDPLDVAHMVLAAVRHRVSDVVPAGLGPRAAILIRTLWPDLFFWIMAARARKEQKPKGE